MPTFQPVPLVVPVLLIALGVSGVGLAMYYRGRGVAFRKRYYLALFVAVVALLLAGAFSVVSHAA